MTDIAGPHLCATVEKNSREEIRVALDKFKGTHLVDIRVYAQFAGQADVRGPTKKGVSIQVGKLPDLITALQAAVQAARAQGLLPDPS